MWPASRWTCRSMAANSFAGWRSAGCGYWTIFMPISPTRKRTSSNSWIVSHRRQGTKWKQLIHRFLAPQRSLIALNAVQVLGAAEKELLANHRRRGVDWLVETIDGQHFQLVAALEHQGRAVAIGDINTAV